MYAKEKATWKKQAAVPESHRHFYYSPAAHKHCTFNLGLSDFFQKAGISRHTFFFYNDRFFDNTPYPSAKAKIPLSTQEKRRGY